MKPVSEMTKKELLAYAEAQGLVLSSATRLGKAALARAIRAMMQEKYRREN